ncbi:MAG: hypothetical protein RLZZ241_1706 [Bacteroidota bacterium]
MLFNLSFKMERALAKLDLEVPSEVPSAALISL